MQLQLIFDIFLIKIKLVSLEKVIINIIQLEAVAFQTETGISNCLPLPFVL